MAIANKARLGAGGGPHPASRQPVNDRAGVLFRMVITATTAIWRRLRQIPRTSEIHLWRARTQRSHGLRITNSRTLDAALDRVLSSGQVLRARQIWLFQKWSG